MTRRSESGNASERYLARVEEICRLRGATLTPIRRDVLCLLFESPNGLKAYDLLARIREGRSNAAPPTVYRALDFLIEHGLVHKIGRINQYVACRHESHRLPSLYLLCPRCGGVDELADEALADSLLASVGGAGHELDSPEVEITAICPACRLAGA